MSTTSLTLDAPQTWSSKSDEFTRDNVQDRDEIAPWLADGPASEDPPSTPANAKRSVRGNAFGLSSMKHLGRQGSSNSIFSRKSETTLADSIASAGTSESPRSSSGNKVLKRIKRSFSRPNISKHAQESPPVPVPYLPNTNSVHYFPSSPPSPPPNKKARKTYGQKSAGSLAPPARHSRDVISIENIQNVPVEDVVRFDEASQYESFTSLDTSSSPTHDDSGFDGDEYEGRWTSRFNSGTAFTNPFTVKTSSSTRKLLPEAPRLSPTSVYAASHAMEVPRRMGSSGSTPAVNNTASWEAPESWAVPKRDEEPGEPDSTSDEEEALPTDTFVQGGSGSVITDTGADGPNGKAPLPARKTSQPNNEPTLTYKIRIYRSDGHHHVVSCPLNITVAKLTPELHVKLELPRETHRLYLRERGRERLLAQTEKPAVIMRRRLEHAGYDAADGLEALGGDDIQFLLKFVFRSERLGGKEEQEITPDSFEYIDLSGRSLQTVPIMLHRHAQQIITLNLSRNPLLEIPLDFIQSCETLRELRLLNMAMKKVPQSVRHSTSLQRLDVSCNRIVDLDEAGLDRIPGLRDLKVQNNRLEGIPTYFRNLRELNYLNISNNKFDTLPDVVCEITRLIDLDISFNNISSLPGQLGQLRHLERLIIVGNQVTELPESCCGIVNLKEFDCRRNNITDLSVICRLPRLATLRADYNTVHALDLSLGPSFKTLEVTHNDITRLALVPGPTGAKPFSLTHLDISHAKLSSLDDFALAALKSLEYLKMDYNSFRSIPDVLCSLTELSHLSCSDNELDALPADIGHLQKLTYLDAHNNHLSEVPRSVWNCASLTHINMSSNLIAVWDDPPDEEPVPSDLPVDDSSRFDRKMSHPLPPIPPPLARSLKRLYLGDNRLEDNVFHLLTMLKELVVLNLSFNKIQEIPPFWLQSLSQLEELYLSGNKLTSLPSENLYKLTRLTTLFLNGNKLQTLPAELRKVQNLAVLDVGSNVLKYNVNNWEFDWNWNFNQQLKYLNLSGNKRLEIRPDPSLATKKSLDQQRTPQLPLQKQLAQFTGLKDLKVLGLMDVTTLFAPSIPDQNEDRRVRTSSSDINGMAYGIADTLGKLDHVSMFDLVLPRFRSRPDECLFGMFGRVRPLLNNNKLTYFLHEKFPETFTKALGDLNKDRSETVSDALRRTFLSLNKDLFDHLTSPGGRKPSTGSTNTGALMAEVSSLKTGASAVIIYMAGKTMFVANAGNALAVVSRKGEAHLISTKHDPFERSETVRIRAAEGWVSPKGMVNDEVGVSRSFGYYHLLPAVINPRPDVREWTLSELDEFVIVGNHGLWDYVSYKDAVDIARGHAHDPMIAAQKLRDFAMSCGAEGGTMIMVINVADLFTGSRTRQTPADTDPNIIKRPRQDDVADRVIARLEPEVEPPRGYLALVFTDIRNSTLLWEQNAGMATAIRLHHNLMRRLLRLTGGYEVKTEGDAFIVSFSTVLSALHWCFMVQIQLLHESWPLEILECEDGKEIRDSQDRLIARGLSVRMGIHCGTPYCERDPVTRRMDYLGPMVNRAARISQEAAGGQIMCSADIIREINERILTHSPDEKNFDPDTLATIEAIRAKGVKIVEKGEKRMKGLEVPEFLSIVYPGELAGRVELKVSRTGSHPSSRVQYSEEQMRQLANLCVRLESLSSNRVFRPLSTRKASAEGSPSDSIIMYADPDLLVPSIKDRTDEQLTWLLDSFSVRIDNALSTLFLRRQT